MQTNPAQEFPFDFYYPQSLILENCTILLGGNKVTNRARDVRVDVRVSMPEPPIRRSCHRQVTQIKRAPQLIGRTIDIEREEPSARSQHPRHFTHTSRQFRQVPQTISNRDRAHRLAFEGKPHRVSAHERNANTVQAFTRRIMRGDISIAIMAARSALAAPSARATGEVDETHPVIDPGKSSSSSRFQPASIPKENHRVKRSY